MASNSSSDTTLLFSCLIDLGIKYAAGEDLILFFTMSENIVHLANSADVGLHLGMTITR